MIELVIAFVDALVPLVQEGGGSGAAIPSETGTAIGVGIGVGIAGLGAGIAERGIGAAAVGALAEDSISLGVALLLTVIPETIVIFAFVLAFLV
jgi:V/A-type H+-transporting ATPase subunit K